MLFFKRLFGGPPEPFQLMERHDIAGIIAALGHPLPWVRRDAAHALGQLQDPHGRAPLTAVLHDRDADVRAAVQAALNKLNHR
jgi:HEAT repeat protein